MSSTASGRKARSSCTARVLVPRIFRLGLIAALLLASANVARAGPSDGKLSDVFQEELAGLELEPLGPALADTVASTYPVASASSSVTYVYNPQLETFERRTRVLGPIIGERAETIGAGQMNVGVSYSYVSLSSINGEDLDDLVSTPVVNGRVIKFDVEGGVELADGRFTNFLPVYVKADIDVEAQIITPGFTYGLTPDLDLNVTLPIIRTFLRVNVDDEVPDPRLPQFALKPEDNDLARQRSLSVSDSAVGVGDLLVRAKYIVMRKQPFDLAVGLGLSLPSGEEEDFQGIGDVHLAPTVVLSHVFAERVELLLNGGIDINAEDVDRSVGRWAAGFTTQITGPLTGAVVFLGRHEFEEQSDPIDTPFFFQIERNDIFDVAIGLRALFMESGVFSINAQLPLNDDGLRADFIPTAQIEYAFSPPW